MKRFLVAISAVALLVTVGAIASVDKVQERLDPPDFGNDYQVGMAAPGQVQILEEFEGDFPPPLWTVVDNENDGVIWMSNVDWGDPNKTNGSGNSAAVNSDTAGPGIEFDTELISRQYDFCNSVESGMNAKLWYENLAGSDFFEIDVTIDGGADWVNILSWNEDHFAQDVSLDLSPFDGYPSVEIRFRYFDPNTNDWDWDVQIDDFELTSQGTIEEGLGECFPNGDDGAPVPAASTTGLFVLAGLLVIGGSLFVLLRRR